MAQKRNSLMDVGGKSPLNSPGKGNGEELELLVADEEDFDIEEHSPPKIQAMDWDSHNSSVTSVRSFDDSGLDLSLPKAESSSSSSTKRKRSQTMSQEKGDIDGGSCLKRRRNRKQLLSTLTSSPFPLRSLDEAMAADEEEDENGNESGFCEEVIFNNSDDMSLSLLDEQHQDGIVSGSADPSIIHDFPSADLEILKTLYKYHGMRRRQSGLIAVKIDKFSSLPDEMILRILKSLSQKSLGRIAQVSKQFRRLTHDESLWRKIDVKGKIISAVSTNVIFSRRPVYLRLCQAVLKTTSLDSELVASQLEYLDLSAATVSAPVLTQLFQKCSSLQKLSLENLQLSREAILAMQVFAHSIDTLNLTMCSDIDAEALCDFFVKCKRLKELNMGCVKQNWTRDNFSVIVKCLPRTIDRLNLAGFRNTVIDSHVLGLVGRLANLIELDISDCSELTSTALQTIAAGFKKLERLGLSRCYGIPARSYSSLVGMKSLAFLDIFSLFKDTAIAALEQALPGVTINSQMFSTIARPTVGVNRSSIWSIRVRF